MASLTTMVKRCMGLVGTKDVTDWENIVSDFMAAGWPKQREAS